ncbi:hypothetical protein [Polyangium aurulentum]|uniref:hypothetical protein n=1 Tax=Polyangium aurulentum TaxID=2567896 RepID=UPI0010AE7681|nr:hypothetical protein [Polyangium aurulentum]UQA62779.1 hypothetical protein E8A73_020945 [Polyangium aurulentum]
MRPSLLLLLGLLGAGCQSADPAMRQPAPETSTAAATLPAPQQGLKLVVSAAPALGAAPVDGRLLVVLARSGDSEPRMQVGFTDDTAQVFGVDVDGFAPGREVALGADALGYPVGSLAQLPAGDYWVQAVLHRYETFRRADGHVVKLPMDRGEGQHWNLAPGNWVSTPQRMRVDPSQGGALQVVLDKALPELPPPPTSKYVRHVRIKSELLSRFWGRDMHLGAFVLLPEGWDAHPQARYPLMVYHGHFPSTLTGWRETPADPSLPAVNREALVRECPNGHGNACKKHGYERVVQEAGHRLFQQWTGKGFPRVLLVEIQHANPYYDDSYAVNSQNVGPYGDAIVRELLPHIEREFRGIGEGWARGMYGGSTGGWEAMAAQVFYPDDFNGAVANCPDPIDFRSYQGVNMYEDRNAFFTEGPLRRTPRAASRDRFGRTTSTFEQDNRMELVLGEHSRSGEQFDIWEAVFSPVGPDGYPKRVYDKRTGDIDPAVVAYWRDHYDLSHILARDWATLGPKLAGKLWVNVGNLDTFFLDSAVRLAEERLQTLKDPTPDIRFQYGAYDGHCWSGDAQHPNFESRLTYHARFIPLLVERFKKTAPKGADTKSWDY